MLYILGIFCVLLGFTTGIFTALKYAEVVSFKDIADTTLLNYLSNNASIIGLFFARFIGYLFLLILIFFLLGIIWLAPLGFLFIIYKSFIYGLTITFFVILCGVGGILLTIFVLIPVSLIVLVAFTILVVTCVSRSFLCRRYSSVYVCNDAPNYLLGTIYIVAVLFIIACLIELLLLPIVSTTIIIII
ncbi:MAG: hypothetical protein CVV59_00705 [Tenericutes bacterium HGW-Tenericutes-4]|nr:MAG: hypothetical protein CVV59_00705 [Tenericutes bacterium HGW-Tenericutes-4]